MTGMRWAGMCVALGVAVGCGRGAPPVPVEKAKVDAPVTSPPAAVVPVTAVADPVKPPVSEPNAEGPERSPKVAPPASEPAPATPAAIGSEGMKAGDVRDDNGLKMQLVWCPPGEFLMGSPKNEPDRLGNEDQVRVTLTKGFWLGRTEVTQEQWKSVMETEPWKGEEYVKEGATYPATYVSWDDAVSFCRKLTDAERTAGRLPAGWEYRLPTEAEWEYACRAGSETAYSFGADASKLSDHAWFHRNADGIGEQHAHAVGLKKANAWGLFDMHGNVNEWCGDGYGAKLSGGRDPVGPSEDSYRVHRGGSWGTTAGDCRSAFRAERMPEYRFTLLGFRVARCSVR